MRSDDFIIMMAYFSIPLQILASLYQYPRLAMMPMRLLVLVVLFAFFIFLCGAGHFLRCMEQTEGTAFAVTNFFTAVVSLATCLYLIPLVPSLMSSLDENLQSLKTLNEELEASKRKLMTFMAFLCHEIRNPLFVITSNISFLEDNSSAERPSREIQEQALQAISQSSDVMLRLVNDVLDISKLESGKLELQEHDFDLQETLQGVANSTHRLIQQRHRGDITFVPFVAENVPKAVFADSVRFLQIVYNLLSNANKFTEQGEIHFRVSVVDSVDASPTGFFGPGIPPSHSRGGLSPWADPGSNNENSGLLGGVDYGESGRQGPDDQIILKIEVEDTGVGIPPSRIERLFQPYAQSKLANYRIHGGTGLGLAIVSKLTLAMGGNVRVKSELDRGSKFEVYLPLQVSTTAHEASPTKGSTSPTFRRNGSFVQLSAATGVEMSSVTAPLPQVPQSPSTPAVSTPSALFSVPPASSTVPTAPPRAPLPGPSTPRKKTIVPFDFPKGTGVVLVVDDNDMNRKLLKRMLTQFKVQHVEASNGQEAVDVMLSSRHFTNQADAPEIAMVLMDLSMPVMDGYEATSTIRRYRNFASLPIIALTAATVEEGKQRAVEAGVTEYQTKPIKRDMLYTLCQRYLHKVASAPSPPPPPRDLLT